MSVVRTDYVLIGCRIHGDAFEDVLSKFEYDDDIMQPCVGRLAIVKDYMGGAWTYAGYILAVSDEYEGFDPAVELDLSKFDEKVRETNEWLLKTFGSDSLTSSLIVISQFM